MRRIWLVLPVLACRQLANIQPVVLAEAGPFDSGAPDVSDSGVCSSGTALLSTPSSYDNVSASGGYAYFEAQSSGLYRCPAAGCASPQTIAASAGGMNYVSFTLAGTLAYYTLQGALDDAGTETGAIHSVNLDGTGDAVVASNLPNPYWVAVSGTRIFWVEDPIIITGAGTATVNCIGCSGATSVPWITGLAAATYALVADQNNVYVVIDDGNTTGVTAGIVYACSTQTACGATPRHVTDSLYVSSTVNTGTIYPSSNGSLAGDGTYGYFVRNTDIVRIDGSGALVTIVAGLDLSNGGTAGIAYDPASTDLYFNGDGTSVFRSKNDGTGSVQLVCGQTGMTGVAVDSSSLYFLASGTGTATNSFPFVAAK